MSILRIWAENQVTCSYNTAMHNPMLLYINGIIRITLESWWMTYLRGSKRGPSQWCRWAWFKNLSFYGSNDQNTNSEVCLLDDVKYLFKSFVHFLYYQKDQYTCSIFWWPIRISSCLTKSMLAALQEDVMFLIFL